MYRTLKRRIFYEKVRKVIVGITIITLSFGALGTTTISAKDINSNIVSPTNIAITTMTNSLTLGPSGKLSCYGKTSVQFGYNAGIIVELQQKNGGWSTIKTWSNSSSSFAIVDKGMYLKDILIA